jgi:hypothetical protein
LVSLLTGLTKRGSPGRVAILVETEALFLDVDLVGTYRAPTQGARAAALPALRRSRWAALGDPLRMGQLATVNPSARQAAQRVANEESECNAHAAYERKKVTLDAR